MKHLLLIINVLLLINVSLLAQQSIQYHSVDQPDADGRIIKGREGTHHWQPYMKNADLSDYHHASSETVEEFKDLKYGIRIHWGIYSIVNGRESWVIKAHDSDQLAYQGFYHNLY